MCNKSSVKKTKVRNARKKSRPQLVISAASLKMRYKFLILLGVLVLAETAIIMHIETPVVWTFLYGIGGWAALTNNLGKNLS
jgi:hypothetical protein